MFKRLSKNYIIVLLPLLADILFSYSDKLFLVLRIKWHNRLQGEHVDAGREGMLIHRKGQLIYKMKRTHMPRTRDMTLNKRAMMALKSLTCT
jgi:hypothetical protein